MDGRYKGIVSVNTVCARPSVSKPAIYVYSKPANIYMLRVQSMLFMLSRRMIIITTHLSNIECRQVGGHKAK